MRELASILSGRRGLLDMRARIVRSDASGEDLGLLRAITSASVQMSNGSQTTWKMDFEAKATTAFDPTGDWLKLFIRIDTPTSVDGFLEYPLGLYKIQRPSKTYLRTHSEWSLSARSGEVLLADDMPEDLYTVPAGTKVLQKVRDILLDLGIPRERIRLPWAEDRALTSAQVFDPFSQNDAKSWYGICSALLNGRGFYSLWTDANGNFVTDRYYHFEQAEPHVRYGPGGELEPTLGSQVSDDYDDDRFANKIFVYSEDTEETEPIHAVAKNTNLDSEASRQNFGRWVSKSYSYKSLESPATAQELARSLLRSASGYNRKLGYTTPLDPERGPREKMYLYLPREDDEDLDSEWTVDSWSAEVFPQISTMEFSASKLERI